MKKKRKTIVGFKKNLGPNLLEKISKQFSAQLKKIKVFIVDVDGVLTDGRVYYSGSEIGFNRFFQIHDGYILKCLRQWGIMTAVISGGDSIGLKKRLELLNINFVCLGNEDKREAYLKIQKESGCSDEEILYIGDEIFDIPLLKRAGFAATVPEAVYEVKNVCHYVTLRKGGEGAVREVADMLRYARNFPLSIDEF